MFTNTPVLSRNTKEYRRRKPEYSPYYQCIEDYYEEFERSYDRNFINTASFEKLFTHKIFKMLLEKNLVG